MNLDRDSLLGMFKAKTVAHELEPGKQVLLRELTVAQIEDARAENKAHEAEATAAGSKPIPFGVRLLAWSLVDGDGQRLLTSEDVTKLRESGNQHVEFLVGKVLELNGFVKVPEKNSEATANVASSAA